MASAKMYEKNGGNGIEKTQSHNALEHSTSRHIDINNNVSAKLRNPLAGIPRENLMAQVEDFARQRDLEHALPALKKGALLAQNPGAYNSMPELTEEERAIIEREHTHR